MKARIYLEEAQERLEKNALRLELTDEQISELRADFSRLMEKYDLLPSELNLVLGSIGAVIWWEKRLEAQQALS